MGSSVGRMKAPNEGTAPARPPSHTDPPALPLFPRASRGGGSCSLAYSLGILMLASPCAPAVFSHSPSCCSLFGQHSPSCSQTHVHRHAPVSLSHRRDLGLPGRGCCQRHSGQGTQCWQPSPQQGWPHCSAGPGDGSGMAGSPQPAPTGCSSPHRWTATPR